MRLTSVATVVARMNTVLLFVTAAYMVGCVSENPILHGAVLQAGDTFIATNSEALTAVCQTIEPYLAQMPKQRHLRWSGNYNSGSRLITDDINMAASYDGTMVTGVKCHLLSAEYDAGVVMVDVCEKSPTMASVRALLAERGMPVPEGCNEGPLKVAQIRSANLKKTEAVECTILRRIRRPTCYMVQAELEYYTNILKRVPYGNAG